MSEQVDDGQRAAVGIARERLALDVLTATLALSLWVVGGSLLLAIADGLGEHPVRRASVGVVLVAGYVLAIWKRRWVCEELRERPSLVVGVAAAQLLAVTIDQPLGSPFAAVSLTSIGLAVVAARARTVWLCVALLVVGYAAAVLAVDSPGNLAREGDLGGAIGLLVSFPVAAALLLGLRRLLTRFVADADRILPALRAGAPVLTPALATAVANPRTPLLLASSPPARTSKTRLTTTEVRVVESLARGFAPKQVAREMGVAVSTVRTHIRNAKRKTGARTLRELSSLVSHPDWPAVDRLRG